MLFDTDYKLRCQQALSLQPILACQIHDVDRCHDFMPDILKLLQWGSQVLIRTFAFLRAIGRL